MSDLTPAPPLGERLQEIEARVKAATPGPWIGVIKQNGKAPGLVGRADDRGRAKCLAVLNGIPGGAQRKADTEFVAHSREDIPFLLSTIRALRAERDGLRGALSRIARMRPEDAGVTRMDVAEFAAAALHDEGTPDG